MRPRHFKHPLQSLFQRRLHFRCLCPILRLRQSSVNCSSPQFSAGNGPTVLPECPRRISQRFVAGGRVRGCPGNTSAALPFPESGSRCISGAIPLEVLFRTHWPISDRGFPFPGIRPDSLREMESEGSSWYNGLEASLTKRLGHGLQFLASYTFSKTLDTDGADINSTSAGNALTLGDQNSPSTAMGTCQLRPYSSIRF